MTGDVSPLGQVAGASVAGGAAVTALPYTAGNSVFTYLLIGTVSLATAVILTRLVKMAVVKFSK